MNSSEDKGVGLKGWLRGKVPKPKLQESTTGQVVLDKHRIAVLPFVSISPDPNDEYFADGLTEEMIGRLSLVSGLEVIARTSVMTYKKKEKTANQIGRELGVGTLLEGSVRKAGNRIRVTAQLINANTEGHTWMENYDRSLEDIFAVQSEVAEKVASSLQLRLTEQDKKRIEKGGTSNTEAYTLYLKGLFHVQRVDKTELSTAVSCFEQALAKDQNFALAYYGLAHAHSWFSILDMTNNKVATEKAKEYATKALELDESLSEAHLSLAMVRVNEYDFVGAGNEAKRAIELNPNLAQAHLFLAWIYVYAGRRGDSIQETAIALELDPLSVLTSGQAGSLYLFLGLYDKAIQHLTNALELDPSNAFCLDNIGIAYIQKGLVKKGLELVMKAKTMWEGMFPSDLVYAYVKAGKPDEARRVFAELQSTKTKASLAVIAGAYAVLGEKERALELLERAYNEHSGYIVNIGVDFVFDSLRNEPRFRALLDKMGIKTIERMPNQGQGQSV